MLSSAQENVASGHVATDQNFLLWSNHWLPELKQPRFQGSIMEESLFLKTGHKIYITSVFARPYAYLRVRRFTVRALRQRHKVLNKAQSAATKLLLQFPPVASLRNNIVKCTDCVTALHYPKNKGLANSTNFIRYCDLASKKYEKENWSTFSCVSHFLLRKRWEWHAALKQSSWRFT